MWPFIKRKQYITFNGQRHEVKPLTLDQTMRLIWLIMPYLPLLQPHLPQIQTALEGQAHNPKLLSTILMAIRGDLQETPGDMIKIVAILAGLDPVWLAQTATPNELIAALPVLDRVHDLPRLARLIYQIAVNFNAL